MAEDGLLLLTASYKLVSRNDQTRVNPALTQYVCAVLKGKVDKSLISSKGARGEAWDYSLRVTEKITSKSWYIAALDTTKFDLDSG